VQDDEDTRVGAGAGHVASGDGDDVGHA
jgi:hypothetical protein